MFIKSKSLSLKQKEQLKPLLDEQIVLRELMIDDVPDGMHLIFAHHVSKTSHFYIFDKTEGNQLNELNASILRAMEQ